MWPCAYLPCSNKICYCYLCWAMTRKRKINPQESFSNHFQDNFIFMSVVFCLFKAWGSSHLSFPHLPKTFYQSGSLAESHWIWPVSLRLTTTGLVRWCIFYPSFPPFISMCLHFFSFNCSPTLTPDQDTRLGSWQAQACVMCVCFLKHL